MVKATSTKTDSASTQEHSELGQLREIVFGSAQRLLEDKIEALRNAVDQQFAQFKASQDKAISALQTSLTDTEQRLLDKLSESDRDHGQQSTKLEEALESAKTQLSSEIEMTDTSGKEDTDALHNRLDKEIRQLTQLLNEYRTQSLEKLAEVNHELNSSKTDRKTLAKLLAAMATNLEADEDIDA